MPQSKHVKKIKFTTLNYSFLFMKSKINMGISFYSKIPDHLKVRGKINPFKKDLKILSVETFQLYHR
jgi:hypothetical protein